jgi:hypothetical protein
VYGDNKMAQWLDWCVGGTVVGGACGYESVPYKPIVLFCIWV